MNRNTAPIFQRARKLARPRYHYKLSGIPLGWSICDLQQLRLLQQGNALTLTPSFPASGKDR